MVDSIVLETQGKLGVVMLVMHNINNYTSFTWCYSIISPMIDITFVLRFWFYIMAKW